MSRPLHVVGPADSIRHRSDEPDMVHELRGILRRGEPLELLMYASSFIDIADARNVSPFERRENEADGLALGELVLPLLDIPVPEATAFVAAIAALTTDLPLRTQVRRGIASRRHMLPRWLDEIDGARCTVATEIAHVLGDGDNVTVGVQIPHAEEISVVAYIDHNMGTVVKDGFLNPESAEQLTQRFLQLAGDPNTSVAPLSLADARTRIDEAMTLSNMTWPPFESETWPRCRPIVEWATRLLPDGGTGYQRHEWSEAESDDLAARVLASPFGTKIDTEDGRGLLDSLLWHGTSYCGGNPLRWSPVRVEVVLCDWLPRKIVADAAYLAQAPDVLRALIRFSHAERDIPPDLTDETLAAVDEFEPYYQKVIRSDRPQGVQALMQVAGFPGTDLDNIDMVLDPAGAFDEEQDLAEVDIFNDADFAQMMQEIWRERIVEAVGHDHVATFTDDALPDEPFDWTGIHETSIEPARVVLELIDDACGELLDIEHRTAARRLLAMALRHDSRLLRRGSAETAAGAILWSVCRANDTFDTIFVADLAEHLHVTVPSLSGRAGTFLKAAGFEKPRYGTVGFGRPDLLTSACRAELSKLRDRL